jgi:hypothetical protein
VLFPLSLSFAPIEPIKKPQPEMRAESAFSEQRRCYPARRWTRGPVTSDGTFGFPYFKLCARPLARKYPFRINAKLEFA